VLECLAEGIASGAVERNRESSGHCLVAADGVQPPMLDLCFDPQTSGGLLIAVPSSAAADLLERLHAAGVTEAAVIGKVVGAGSGRIFLRTDGRRPIQCPSHLEGKGTEVIVGGDAESLTAVSRQSPPSPSPCNDQPPATQEAHNMACCESNHESNPSASDAGGATLAGRKFQEFLQAAAAPGALDAKTKQAIAIALSVVARCEPCVKSHMKKARAMGFSQEEIDEAAWLAIGFGGSPTMVFYNGVRKAAEPTAQ
jgi:AhpD family alkylhydroperoxidase